MTNDIRLQQLSHWLETQLNLAPAILPLQNDASFRRYFRVQNNSHSWIAMDAPPEKEDCRPFVLIARGLHEHGIKTPEIIFENLTEGFLLLNDFGDQLLLPLLNHETADRYYRKTFSTLALMQECHEIPQFKLPNFNEEFIRYELNLFVEWYLTKNLQCDLQASEKKLLEDVFQRLITNANEQPQIFIHRDFHSRNLMILQNEDIGVLDFQDAMIGPVTYDVVSLLKDCYITWPREKVLNWLQDYYHLLKMPNVSLSQFIIWFDLTGLQRHLKVLGIFSRLHFRDHKSKYLLDIPRVLSYVLEVCEIYPEFFELHKFLKSVQPDVKDTL